MRTSAKTTIMLFVFLQLLLLPNISNVEGEYTVISSRVSLISDISINSHPNFFLPNTTQFTLNATVEILNRDDQNQSVIESSDISPKVFLNASFVNQSLELEVRKISNPSVTIYSYLPGITVEVNPMIFYINQTGLPFLPDGNYTFWRPINMGTQLSNMTPGDAFEVILHMSSGAMNITYIPFDYTVSEYTALSIIFPITTLLVVPLLIYGNLKRKI